MCVLLGCSLPSNLPSWWFEVNLNTFRSSIHKIYTSLTSYYLMWLVSLSSAKAIIYFNGTLSRFLLVVIIKNCNVNIKPFHIQMKLSSPIKRYLRFGTIPLIIWFWPRLKDCRNEIILTLNGHLLLTHLLGPNN